MMRVASHQPCFLPWAGFWHKVASVDHFVLSAGVEWAKDGYLNRTQHNGAWLTLPVQVKDGERILDAKIADDRRKLGKVWKTVQQQAGPYRERLSPIITTLQGVQPGQSLLDVNLELIYVIRALLGIATKFSVDTDTPLVGSKTERLRDRLLRHVPDMQHYYLGQGALEYFSPKMFAPVACFAQSPSHFDPNVSIVQLIAQSPDPLATIRQAGSWRRL